MEQMVLMDGRPLWNGAHNPVKVPQVVSIAVTPPVSIAPVVSAATGNLPVRGSIIRRVIQRPEGITPGLKIACLCIVKSVDRRPAPCGAPITGARTAPVDGAVKRVGRPLFVNGPRSQEGPKAKIMPNPVDQMSNVLHPQRVIGGRVRPAQNVIRGVVGGLLVKVLGVFRDVLKVTAPFVP